MKKMIVLHFLWGKWSYKCRLDKISLSVNVKNFTAKQVKKAPFLTFLK